jgi:hypothetical protein
MVEDQHLINRWEVKVMINDAIERVEEKRDKQFEVHLSRVDKIDSKLNRIVGAIILIGVLVPLVVHFLPR